MSAPTELNANLNITRPDFKVGKRSYSGQASSRRQSSTTGTWPGSIRPHLLKLLNEISDGEKILKLVLCYGPTARTSVKIGHEYVQGNFVLRSTGDVLDVTTYNVALTLFPNKDLRPDWMYREGYSEEQDATEGIRLCG